MITKVTSPSVWVNPLAKLVKIYDLRLCMNPKVLNKYLRQEYEYISTEQELVSDMNGAAVFTKLDASSAFYQILILNVNKNLRRDPESFKLLGLQFSNNLTDVDTYNYTKVYSGNSENLI